MSCPSIVRTRTGRRLAHSLVPWLAIATGIIACGEGTGPVRSIRVGITSSVADAPAVQYLPDGTPLLRCSVQITALGTGGRLGEWTGGTLRWYAGVERVTPFDTSALAGSDLRQAWANPDDTPAPLIPVGRAIRTQFTLSASVPFEVEIDLRYRDIDTNAEDVASSRVQCGPTVPVNAPAPAITALGIPTTSTIVHPGDTVRVTFGATSPAMLWRSFVTLDGPCHLEVQNVEPLVASVTRTVELVIPRDCRAGVPFTLTARVLDGAGRIAERMLPTALQMVDTTPPVIARLAFSVPSSSLPVAAPSGTFFVGDSMFVQVEASDNGAVAWFVWQVSPNGTRDSIPYSGSLTQLRLPVRAAWDGAQEFVVSVRDVAGNESAARRFDVRGLLGARPAIARAARVATIDGWIGDIAIDARRDVIYLQQGGRILVLSRASMTVTGSIPMPDGASGADLTAGGDSLLFVIPSTRSLGVVDLRGATPVVSTVAIAALAGAPYTQAPDKIFAMADGRAFVVAQNVLVEVRLADGTSRVRTDAGPTGVLANSLAVRSLDRRVLVVRDRDRLLRWSTSTDAFTSSAVGDFDYAPLTVDATGATIAIGQRVFDASLAFVRRVGLPSDSSAWLGGANMLTPDGQTLHLVAGGLVRTRTSDGAVLDRLDLPMPANFALAWPNSDRIVALLRVPNGPNRVMVVE